MKKYSEAFVGFDTAKKKHAVAVADGGRDGEVRYLGEIDSSPATIEKVIGKLAAALREAACLLRSRSDGVWAVPPGQALWVTTAPLSRHRLSQGSPASGSRPTGVTR